MPPDPPRKARALPSQWSLRDYSLNRITSQVSRLQLSKSWQVCNAWYTITPQSVHTPASISHCPIALQHFTHRAALFDGIQSTSTIADHFPCCKQDVQNGTQSSKRRVFPQGDVCLPLDVAFVNSLPHVLTTIGRGATNFLASNTLEVNPRTRTNSIPFMVAGANERTNQEKKGPEDPNRPAPSTYRRWAEQEADSSRVDRRVASLHSVAMVLCVIAAGISPLLHTVTQKERKEEQTFRPVSDFLCSARPSHTNMKKEKSFHNFCEVRFRTAVLSDAHQPEQKEKKKFTYFTTWETEGKRSLSKIWTFHYKSAWSTHCHT